MQRYATHPFTSAETAWFWTAAALKARQEGRRTAEDGPCEPEEVVKCLDRLYRHRRIELLHVRILRNWGWRGTAPNPGRPRERNDWQIWREALERLEYPLRMRGIVQSQAGQQMASAAE